MLRIALPLLLMACSPSTGGAGKDPTGPGSGLPGAGTAAGTPAGSPAGTPAGSTTSRPWELDVDCSQLLPLPYTVTTYTWVPGHEDFHFSADGRMFGTAGGSLRATPFGGPTEVVVPGVGDARGTRFLADGTMILAHVAEQSLIRVDPVSGSSTLIRGGLNNPKGIAIGLDGRAYVATSGQILAIDPDNGDMEVVADLPGNSFDGITFSPDYTRLYFNEEFGQINWVDINPDGSFQPPVEGPNVPTGAFSILDGMTVDACGNLYVTEMSGRLWRITPDGEMEVAINLPAGSFVPAVNFGPAAGGWNPNAIYVNDFLGRVYEAVVGVPGKWEPHHP